MDFHLSPQTWGPSLKTSAMGWDPAGLWNGNPSPFWTCGSAVGKCRDTQQSEAAGQRAVENGFRDLFIFFLMSENWNLGCLYKTQCLWNELIELSKFLNLKNILFWILIMWWVKAHPGMKHHLGEEECEGNYVLVLYFKEGSIKPVDSS